MAMDNLQHDGQPFDSRVFSETAGPVSVGRLTGVAAGPLTTDVGWSTWMAPIVNEQVRDVIESMSPGSVQWIEIAIDGSPEPRFVMQVLHELECLDDERCEGSRGGPEPRPEWRTIRKLCLDRAFDPGGHHIFRVHRYIMAMLVTEDLKLALDGVTGLSYLPVE